MADVKCPSCGKTNPEALEICQFCGTLLKQSRTEPLEPITPGQFPEKKATSDLERTLPGWLRDARRAGNEPNTSPIPQIKVPQDASTPPAQTPPPQKPPASPLDLLAGLSQAGNDDDEVPDWLKNLQGETPAPAAPTASSPPAQETSDWLAELHEEPAEAEKPPQPDAWGFSGEATTFNFDDSEEQVESFGDTPDWLTALEAQEAAPPQQPAADLSSLSGPDSAETPDWLASLGGIGTASTFAQSESATPEPAPAESGETPDWLASLGGFETPSQAPAESVPAEMGADLPDWLADLQTSASPAALETPAPAPQGEAPASDLPDWMAGLQETPAVELTGQVHRDPATPEVPASTLEIPASDLPDWMAGLQETPTAEIPAPVAEIPASDLPDWMGGLPETPTAEIPASVSAEAPASDLPDWMAGLPETPAAETPASTLETPASDLPDWMAGLPETPAAEVPASTLEIPASDLPDWMGGLPETPAAEIPASVSAEVPASDLPDWLSTAMGETPPAAASPQGASSPQGETPPKRVSKPFPTGALNEFKTLTESEPVPDFLSGIVPTDETKAPEIKPAPAAGPGESPDWLTGMAAGAAAVSFGAETPAPAESEKTIEMEAAEFEFPSLEAEPVPAAPAPAESQNIDSLLAMDVPDWLAGFTPSIEAEQPAAGASADDADLQPAELPSWVQAMRPVESMLTGTDAAEGDEVGDVEQQGPLAGFRSVLPVQADLLEIRKPKVYALKLQVDETQRGQATLLEQLLASENGPKVVTASQESPLMRPLRWIIFAALALAVLIPAILGTSAFPAPSLPADANAPFNRFYDTMANAIPDGAPVLVVTDYQPGFAGEMEQAAVPVVAHLMRKNAQMAFISTSPVSTEMGERLLQKSRAFYTENKREVPSYLAGEQYLFLGYLPGGAAGVKAFAEQPQKTTGVDSLSGDLWQKDMLRGKIANISSFAAVIVITDDPDNGRLWIEQTGASLGSTPMLMVTSAQAGPMLQPYAASGQLTGLVIGLEGGALYEQADAQTSDTYSGHIKALYWDGFGAAGMVALLSILVGAIWSLVERFRARQDDTEQDEA